MTPVMKWIGILATMVIVIIVPFYARTEPVQQEKLKDEYYSLRGWDIETGFQTYEKLKELDMEDIAVNLSELGFLG